MAEYAFDEIDAALLDVLQRDFPLTPRPFDVIASRLGIEPGEAMERIARFKRDRVIRQISAIFNSRALGYSSALVAFGVREGMVDSVGEAVSRHTGVSHCYLRDAQFNLWFTITLPPEQDLVREVEPLAQIKGVEASMTLPALRVFKIGVFFEVGEGRGQRIESAASFETAPARISEADLAAVRALQKDLPIVESPFTQLAGEHGMLEQDLVRRAEAFLESGVMRRFAAVLRHRRAGYRANAMVCWKATPEKVEQAGETFARHSSVSHCYERPITSQWPYPLYTMVHGKDDEQLRRSIDELGQSSGLTDYRVLRSIKEYKKSRVVYFA